MADCFALWVTWGHIYYPPAPTSSNWASTSTRGRGNQRRHKPNYLIFPLALLWNVASCRMMLKPQANMEMWDCLWLWIIYLPVLLPHWWVTISCIWYLSFTHGIIIFKIHLYSGVCCKEASSVDIHILVQVTKTYCPLLREIPFKMESQYYWTLVKIFMYVKNEFLKFMNIVSQKCRL